MVTQAKWHTGHHDAHASKTKKKDKDEDLSSAKPGEVHISVLTGKAKKHIASASSPPSLALEVGPSRRQNASQRVKRAAVDAAEAEETIAMFSRDGENAVGGQQLMDLVHFCSNGSPIDAGEIDWIMAMADDNHDHKIGVGEFVRFKIALAGYLNARERIRNYLCEFDANGDAKFQKDELQKLLTSLNDGIQVPDSQVEWVMRNVGKQYDGNSIAIPELEKAINLWYNHAEKPTSSKPSDRDKGGAVGRVITGMTSDPAPKHESMYGHKKPDNHKKKGRKEH